MPGLLTVRGLAGILRLRSLKRHHFLDNPAANIS